MHYAKIGIAIAGDIMHGEIGDSRERRSFDGQAREEILNRFLRALDLDGDAGGGVAYGTSEFSGSRQTINIRPETDALHNSRDFDLPANFHIVSQQLWLDVMRGAVAQARSAIHAVHFP